MAKQRSKTKLFKGGWDSHMLEVRLFGRFEVVRDGEPIEASDWTTEKNKTLLKILLTDPGRPFSSDTLIETLWPESDPAKALNNLKGRVSQLRRILQPGLGEGHQGPRSSFIKTVSGGYCFDPANCWIDTEQFETDYHRAKRLQDEGQSDEALDLYRRAVELYRNDFLPEDNHLDWVVQVRRELKTLYLELVSQSVDILCDRGSFNEAIRFCEKGLVADQHNEAFYRNLMVCHAKLGNASKALDVYETCRERLATSLGVEPSPETHEVYQRLRKQVKLASGMSEREARLDELQRQLATDLDPAARVETLMETGRLLGDLGRHDEQVESLREVVRLTEDIHDPNQEGGAHCELAQSLLTQGHHGQADESIDRAIRCFESTANALGNGRALTIRGNAQLKAGCPNEAQASYEAALRHLEPIEDDGSAEVRLDALSGLGRVASHQGRYGQALDRLDEAYQLSLNAGLRERQPHLLLRIGALHYYMNHPAEARLHWEWGQELAYRLGDRVTESKCLNNLALHLMNEGHLEDALDRYDRLLKLQTDVQDNQLWADVWNNVGRIYDMIGRIEDAFDAYQRSLDHSQRMDDDLGVAEEQVNLAGLHIQRHQLDEAERLLEQAFPVLESADAWWWVAQALVRWGWLEQTREAYEKAVEHFERAAELGAEIGHRQLEIGANTDLALSRRALGETDRAVELARQTSEAIRHVPSGYYLIATHYRLFRVFEQTDHDALATRHLETAHRLLTEFADRLTHPQNYDAFLADDPNRAIFDAYRQHQIS